jgi:uncharacterized protein involved in outer membrane biogenesis
MKKFFKISVIALSVFILLVIVGGFLVTKFVTLNTFKPLITAQVNKITGRTFTIDGNIHWSLYPVLGIDFKDATLSNLPGFGDQPFIQAADMRVGVHLIPLLSRHVKVEKIVINGLLVNLVKNRQGAVNWKMPARKPAKAEEVADKQKLSERVASLSLKLIDIKNVTINMQNLQTGQKSTLHKVSLHASNIQDHDFFPIKLSFSVDSNQPNVTGNVNLSGKLKAIRERKQYQLHDFILITKLRGKDVPQGKLDMQFKSDVSIANNEFATDGLNLVLNGNTITGNIHATGTNNISAFNLSDIVRPLNINGDLQSKRLKFAGMNLNNAKLKLQGQNGIVKIAPLTADMYGGGLQVNAQINLQQATPNIAVQYKYNNFNLASLASGMYGSKKITGRGNIWGNITTRSFGGPKMLSTLNGTTSFKLNNGVIKGVDVAYLIYQGRKTLYTIVQFLQKDKTGADDDRRRAIIAAKHKNTKQTRFSSITGSNKIRNGVANGNFSIASPDIRGNGGGTINLIKRYVGYRAKVGLKGELSDWVVPVVISGPFGKVKARLDKNALNQLAQQMVKKQIQKHIQKHLKQQIQDNIKKIIPKIF